MHDAELWDDKETQIFHIFDVVFSSDQQMALRAFYFLNVQGICDYVTTKIISLPSVNR